MTWSRRKRTASKNRRPLRQPGRLWWGAAGWFLSACVSQSGEPSRAPIHGTTEHGAPIHGATEHGATEHGTDATSAAESPPTHQDGERRGSSASEPTVAHHRPPFDETFVRAEIPAGDAARYTRWRQIGQTTIGKGYLYFLEPLNEGRWLIVKSADDVDVRILDVQTRAQLFSWPVHNFTKDDVPVVLPWTGSGPPAVLIVKGDGLWLYAADSGQVLRRLSELPASSARWSKDGRILMTSDAAVPEQTSRFRLFERQSDETLTLIRELPLSERVDGWDLSRDNRFLARSFYPSERVTVLDLVTAETLLDVPSPQYAGSVEFSPDGRWLALGGAGVKWIDLSNPARRTEYSYFYNNVAEVEFSPSGDVLVATSYDGSVRLLTYDEKANRLQLVTTLRHQGKANVYAARFLHQGNLLVTSSGDRTVRYWSGKKSEAPGPSGAQWRDPISWLSWGAERQRVPSPELTTAGERYVPARLHEAPLPSRIKPGSYACKISAEYKLRDCTVELDAQGHTLLEFHEGNLLALRGVLFDDGPVVRFEGWLTEAGSLGCATCAQQPLHAVFRGQGRSWQGLLLYKSHYDPRVQGEVPAADAKFEEAIDRFPLKLVGK